MVFEVMVEGKNQVWTHFYYITEMFFINKFFPGNFFRISKLHSKELLSADPLELSGGQKSILQKKL